VLGRTALAAELETDPLMRYITTVDPHLFSYGRLVHGDTLGFDAFWGGRTSCKRRLLVENGIFDSRFTFGCEDIELGLRLAQVGLRVLYNGRAVTRMIRGLDLTAVWQRLWRQGRSNLVFSRLHSDQVVKDWVGTGEDDTRAWSKELADEDYQRAQHLDRLARVRIAHGIPLRDDEIELLFDSYRLACAAAKTGGFVEASQEPNTQPFSTAATPASPE
jgi:hypothetical protein